MYQERMLGYYPPVIQSITEFQAIINSEYPEFEDIIDGVRHLTEDAYLTTMSEERTAQWEKALHIQPLADSTLSDRRDTIVARIRGQGKLNTALINSIVGAFTGGTANSFIKDGVLHVEITPPADNKQFKFSNVVQELSNKLPAHLGLSVIRDYATWEDIYENFADWNAVSQLDTWGDLMVYVVPE